MDDLYVIKDGKKLRCGYTTGSCAAGAAKAAAIMLHSGTIPDYVEIDTPAETRLRLKVEKPTFDENRASCCIVKDAGDDPDVTNGMEIFADCAAIKREFTLPNVSQTIIVTRLEGRTPVPKAEDLTSLAAHKCSMAIFLSVKQIEMV